MQKSKKTFFVSFYNGVFGLTLAGVVLYLLALPPTGLWVLGWPVAACWTPLLRRKTLPKRAYRKIWLAGVIFWAIAVHWVCYAHWAACFGWLALCCYLGIYFPLFIFFSRTLYHTPIWRNYRFPVWFAAPVAWLAVMYLQKTLMGGFGFALLEHTQIRQTALIQLADVGGESLVGAVMIFVGVSLGYCLPTTLSEKPSVKKTATCMVVIVLTFLFLISYAHWRDSQLRPSDKPPLRVALLQGNFKASLSAPPEWYDEVFENYSQLAIGAAKNKNVDVIIWPESTCVYTWVDVDRSELSAVDLKGMTEEKINQIFLEKYEGNRKITELTQLIDIPSIYGVGSFVYSEYHRDFYQYNSALMVENNNDLDYNLSDYYSLRSKKRFTRYDKMLLVMFGEYIPLAEFLPDNFFLKTLCQKADFGKSPVCFYLRCSNGDEPNHGNNGYINGKYYLASANICFESSSSHLIRYQLLKLKEQREEPDILINLSNDGWFRHSSQIDMHLATHVFRAIENRKPYVAATNGGFSVEINGSGKILHIGKRAKNQVIYAEITADNRFSTYSCVGSFFHITSLGFVFVMFTFHLLRYRRS